MSTELVQRGQQWLEELLQLAGFLTRVQVEQPAPVHPSLAEPGNCWLTIDETGLMPEQVETLIGPEGGTLDAIQYLANATLNLRQSSELQGAYTVELVGYRLRRQTELLALTESAAAQVRQTGEEFEVQPLSAAERRLIHTILQSSPDLETFSRGQEPERRLVICSVQAQESDGIA